MYPSERIIIFIDDNLPFTGVSQVGFDGTPGSGGLGRPTGGVAIVVPAVVTIGLVGWALVKPVATVVGVTTLIGGRDAGALVGVVPKVVVATDVAIVVGPDVAIDVTGGTEVEPTPGKVVPVATPVDGPDVTAGVVGLADVVDVVGEDGGGVEIEPAGAIVVALVEVVADVPSVAVGPVNDGAADVAVVGLVEAAADGKPGADVDGIMGTDVVDGSPKCLLVPCTVRSSLTLPLCNRAVP